MPRVSPEPRVDWKTIINRVTWLFIFLALLFSIVACVKLLDLKIETDISLNSEVVLAFLISFFSLGLSIMFYFKTEETSNRFYDNTYKFTSDTSKILGEIKGEFGEKLQSIDSGYVRIADAISPTTGGLIKQLETVKKELDKSNSNDRASLKNIRQMSKVELQERLKWLESRINKADTNLDKILKETSSPLRDRVLSYTRRRLVEKLGGRSIMHMSDEDLSKKFKILIEESVVPQNYIGDLKELSFIDEKGYLSIEFIDIIRRYGHLYKNHRSIVKDN